MREAETVVRSRCPQWTDLSAGDPGTTLLEAFAYLTDVLLYRLNRVPEKVYITLLNLLGISALPPSAAEVILQVQRSGNLDSALELPAGQQVSDSSGAVVFTFIESCRIAAQADTAAVRAVHAERIEAELVGLGTGEGSQSFKLRGAPLLRPIEGLDTLLVAAETPPGDGRKGTEEPGLEFGGRNFTIWEEVPGFLPPEPERRVYVVDRATGILTFAPLRGLGAQGAAPVPVPGKGQEIRAWYWRGGGRNGNVAPGTLTTFRPSVPNATVTNPARAAGGEDSETLDATIRRAQGTVGALRTAVTARDFERVALETGGIARAHAFAQRERWTFANPGVVEVQVVPAIRPEAPDSGAVNGAVTPEVLHAHQLPGLLERVDAALAERTPIGVRAFASWTRCRQVSVTARVAVTAAESAELVQQRVTARINALLQPSGSWLFGRILRASDIYEVILAEPGVRFAEGIGFRIESGPEALVRDMARDPTNAQVVLVATENGVFRSLDFGRSWSLQDQGLPHNRVTLLSFDPETPGLVAAVLESADAPLWTVCISADLGERWEVRDQIQNEPVYSAAWVSRGGRPRLLLGTRRAMRRLERGASEGSGIIGQLLRTDTNTDYPGVVASASMRHPSGTSYVAVARTGSSGVLISMEGSESGSFEMLPGSQGKDVRVLVFQRDGERTFLWAGLAAEAGAAGEGLMRIEARADGIDPAGWTAFGNGWQGGSCEGIDFAGQTILAGTNRAGVLTLDLSAPAAQRTWRAPELTCGLPIHTDRRALIPVSALSARAGSDGGLSKVLVGTERGVFESTDALSYSPAGNTDFTEQVPLPANWLYCAGTHAITVLHEQNEWET